MARWHQVLPRGHKCGVFWPPSATEACCRAICLRAGLLGGLRLGLLAARAEHRHRVAQILQALALAEELHQRIALQRRGEHVAAQGHLGVVALGREVADAPHARPQGLEGEHVPLDFAEIEVGRQDALVLFEDRQGLAEAAGLKPVVVDIESHASRLAAGRLIEALPKKGVDAMVALFEVGALTTSMQVIRNDEVLYDRDQAFGGAQLTQLIVRQYGFSVEEAESKKRSGDMTEEYQSAVLRPFVDSMAQEIGRALQFFFTSTPHNRVDHVMLAGGSAPLPGLTEAVTQQTGFACSAVNPFDGMEIGSSVRLKKMVREAPSYLTSCGLAMRRFLQ